MVALTLVFSGVLVCWGFALIYTNQTEDASMASAIADAQRLVERMQQLLEPTIASYASYGLAACQLLAERTGRHRQLLLASYLSFLDQRAAAGCGVRLAVVCVACVRAARTPCTVRCKWTDCGSPKNEKCFHLLVPVDLYLCADRVSFRQ